MKNLLIFCSAIALVLLTGIARSYSPSELNAKGDANIDSVAQLKIADSTGSKVTEVDGVQLEILMPEREFIIPDGQDNQPTSSPVKIGIRITNKNDFPLRFTLFDTLIMELSAEDGYHEISTGGPRRMKGKPREPYYAAMKSESDYPVVKPGESTTFYLNGSLEWVNGRNELVLGFPDGFQGGWFFGDLKPNKYKLNFFYYRHIRHQVLYDLETKTIKWFDNLWSGSMASPTIEINLIERH